MSDREATGGAGGAAAEVALDTRVTQVGSEVAAFAEEGFLILFGEGAPVELKDMSVLHAPGGLNRDVVAGDKLWVNDRSYTVTAVGDVVNRNLREIGHATLKFNGRDTAELPGDLCLEAGPVPVLKVGDRIRITH